MFFELSKFFRIFLSPISWVLLLILGAFLLKGRGWRRGCGIGATIFFLLLTNNLLVERIRFYRMKDYQTAAMDTAKQYRLAVVMGGFGSMNRRTGALRYEQDRADRLWEAVRLYRQGKAERILITGDPTSIIKEDGSSTKELFLAYMEQIGIPDEAFLFEQQARNTRENARYTKAILDSLQVNEKEIVLITSASHMERSLGCFAKVGIHPDYLPVNTYEAPQSVNHRAFYPEWKAALKAQELWEEWIGDIAYRVMGYI